MRSHNRLVVFLVAGMVLGVSAASHAWNSPGHKVNASIAYRQLDEATRAKVADALKAHLAYAELWARRSSNGPDERLNLFYNASVFPDDARGGQWSKYGRSPAHYVNFRIMFAEGNKVLPPLDGENVLNSYLAHLRQVKDRKILAEDRALHLTWIFHQAGDVHMPLHAVARFSKALPEGDRGGNSVRFPSPRGSGGRGSNLHAYWDGLISGDDDPTVIEKVAEELISEYPREGFTAELARTSIGEWGEESVTTCLKAVYRDLDPEITTFADAPVEYETEGMSVALCRGMGWQMS